MLSNAAGLATGSPMWFILVLLPFLLQSFFLKIYTLGVTFYADVKLERKAFSTWSRPERGLYRLASIPLTTFWVLKLTGVTTLFTLAFLKWLGFTSPAIAELSTARAPFIPLWFDMLVFGIVGLGWLSLGFTALQQRLLDLLGLHGERPLHRLALFLIFLILSSTLLRYSSVGGKNHFFAQGSSSLAEEIFIFLVAVLLIALRYYFRDGQQKMITRLRLRSSLPGLTGGIATGIALAGSYFLLPTSLIGLSTLHVFNALDAPEVLLSAGLLFAYLLAIIALELLFRGLLQPRVGMILASLTSYTFAPNLWNLALPLPWHLTLFLLVVAFATGWFAKRYGTWAGVAVHTSCWLASGLLDWLS